MSARFHETRWTLVSRSKGDDAVSRAALGELCEAYYAPVVAFLRRDGRTEDAARDLAHDFFARLLAGGMIAGADPMLGRFRTYLLMALKRFAADQRERANAAKRGGGRGHVAIGAETTEAGTGWQIADERAEAPDAAFDRQWAITVLARALATVEAELRESGKGDHFDVLKPWLTGDAGTPSQAEAAGRLGMGEGALKVAIHRLRKRFRAAVKAEIAQTVSGEGSVEEEMAALVAALCG